LLNIDTGFRKFWWISWISTFSRTRRAVYGLASTAVRGTLSKHDYYYRSFWTLTSVGSVTLLL